MKRVRTKSSDNAGNMEPPKKSKEVSKGGRSPSPKEKRASSPKLVTNINGTKHEPAKLTLKIISHGRVNGPLDEPEDGEEMLNFSVRDVPNPPAKLRKRYTGLSPRLRTEVFSEKAARLKYDTIVIEMEKMMTTMETAMSYDAAHKEEVDEDTPTTLVVSIQCEEGKHRAVSYAEELAQSETTKRKDWNVSVVHRDLNISEINGLDEDDSDEPPSPTAFRAKESIKTIKKKKDKNLKKARDRRLNVEIVGSGAEDGFI